MIVHEVKALLGKLAIGPEGVPLYSRETKEEKRGDDTRQMYDDKIKGLSFDKDQGKGAACANQEVSLE